AGAWRLGRQFVSESFMLGLGGTVLGLALAKGALRVAQSATLPGVSPGTAFAIDVHVLAFALVLGFLTSLGFGLAPIISMLGRNFGESMRFSAARATGTAGAQRFGQILITTQ